MRQQRGLSLVELALAMAMLGILAFAGAAISKNTSNLFFRQIKGVSAGELYDHMFAQFNHDFKMAVRGKKIKWSMTFRSLSPDMVWVLLSGTDEKGGRAAGATARFYRSTTSAPFLNSIRFSDDESYETAGNGICPDALLKDYDRDGDIDDDDKAKKQACLNDFTTCISSSCLVNNRVNLSDPNCLRENVFPFFEFNENLDVIYLSVRPRRRTNTNDEFVYQEPMTKALYLYPNQEA